MPWITALSGRAAMASLCDPDPGIRDAAGRALSRLAGGGGLRNGGADAMAVKEALRWLRHGDAIVRAGGVAALSVLPGLLFLHMFRTRDLSPQCHGDRAVLESIAGPTLAAAAALRGEGRRDGVRQSAMEALLACAPSAAEAVDALGQAWNSATRNAAVSAAVGGPGAAALRSEVARALSELPSIAASAIRIGGNTAAESVAENVTRVALDILDGKSGPPLPTAADAAVLLSCVCALPPNSKVRSSQYTLSHAASREEGPRRPPESTSRREQHHTLIELETRATAAASALTSLSPGPPISNTSKLSVAPVLPWKVDIRSDTKKHCLLPARILPIGRIPEDKVEGDWTIGIGFLPPDMAAAAAAAVEAAKFPDPEAKAKEAQDMAEAVAIHARCAGWGCSPASHFTSARAEPRSHILDEDDEEHSVEEISGGRYHLNRDGNIVFSHQIFGTSNEIGERGDPCAIRVQKYEDWERERDAADLHRRIAHDAEQDAARLMSRAIRSAASSAFGSRRTVTAMLNAAVAGGPVAIAAGLKILEDVKSKNDMRSDDSVSERAKNSTIENSLSSEVLADLQQGSTLLDDARRSASRAKALDANTTRLLAGAAVLLSCEGSAPRGLLLIIDSAKAAAMAALARLSSTTGTWNVTAAVAAAVRGHALKAAEINGKSITSLSRAEVESRTRRLLQQHVEHFEDAENSATHSRKAADTSAILKRPCVFRYVKILEYDPASRDVPSGQSATERIEWDEVAMGLYTIQDFESLVIAEGCSAPRQKFNDDKDQLLNSIRSDPSVSNHDMDREESSRSGNDDGSSQPKIHGRRSGRSKARIFDEQPTMFRVSFSDIGTVRLESGSEAQNDMPKNLQIRRDRLSKLDMREAATPAPLRLRIKRSIEAGAAALLIAMPVAPSGDQSSGGGLPSDFAEEPSVDDDGVWVRIPAFYVKQRDADFLAKTKVIRVCMRPSSEDTSKVTQQSLGNEDAWKIVAPAAEALDAENGKRHTGISMRNELAAKMSSWLSYSSGVDPVASTDVKKAPIVL